MDYQKVFFEEGLFPYPDEDLRLLMDHSLAYMTPRNLVAYIKRVHRFDEKPVHITESRPGEFTVGRTAKIVHWYHLRETLGLFPSLFTAAGNVGLTKQQTTHLLFAIADAQKYDFWGIEKHIRLTNDIMSSCLERGFDFQKALPDFRKLLSLLRREGESLRALGILHLGIKAGLSPEQSIDIVTYMLKESAIAGYALMGLYDELDLLGPNVVPANLLHRALKIIMGEDPYYSQGNYKAFTHLLHLAVTHTDLSQTDVVTAVVHRSEQQKLLAASQAFQQANPPQGNILDAVAEICLPILDSEDGRKKTISFSSTKSPEDYFPLLRTESLVSGILPYRLRKDFPGGICDLKKLMETGYQEGAFIFAPETNTWFSYGGRTDSGQRSVRHEFYPYDISRLSKTPIFVHIHPENTEIFLAPLTENLAFPQLQTKLTKFLAVMPSRADYKTCASLLRDASGPVNPSACIVTSLGITKMAFPNDPEAIENFAESFREIKDRVMLDFNARAYVSRHNQTEDHPGFVQRLCRLVNKKLPPEFQINLLPHHAPSNFM